MDNILYLVAQPQALSVLILVTRQALGSTTEWYLPYLIHCYICVTLVSQVCRQSG